jgi:hypothetical protein
VQGTLSSLPGWRGDVLGEPSGHGWFGKFHLRWVPYALSINQKSERVSYSKLLLMVLMEQKASGFQRIITVDESRFSFIIPVIRSGGIA